MCDLCVVVSFVAILCQTLPLILATMIVKVNTVEGVTNNCNSTGNDQLDKLEDHEMTDRHNYWHNVRTLHDVH